MPQSQNLGAWLVNNNNNNKKNNSAFEKGKKALP